MKPSKPNRYDIVPVVLIILLGAVSLLAGRRLLAGDGGALTAQISLNGTVSQTVVLSSLPESGKALPLENNGVSMTVFLERDGVRVTLSDCPGHDCMSTGKITRPGSSIVCLPGRIVITLKGIGKDNDIDIYAG